LAKEQLSPFFFRLIDLLRKIAHLHAHKRQFANSQ